MNPQGPCSSRGARLAVPWLVAGAIAGCSSTPPKLKLSLAARYEGGVCGAEAGIASLTPKTVRLSARVHDPSGVVTGICDATLSTSAATVEGFPGLRAGSTVDLFAEAFGDGAGPPRLATGALLGVDPTATPLPPLRLFGAESYGCLPGGRLAVPRAFHTATRLDNGQVLIVGGATASADGTDAPATTDGSGHPQFYATASIEVFDPASSSFLVPVEAAPEQAVPRALHRAAVLASDGKTFTILLMGGVTPGQRGQPILAAFDKAAPAGIRMALGNNAASAPAQILVYDSGARPPAVTRMAAPAALQAQSLALQAGAPVYAAGTASTSAGMVVGGGLMPAAIPVASGTLAVTFDGRTAQSGMLMRPRSGAAMVAFRDPGGGSSSALIIGGVAAAKDMPPPFERLTLAAPLRGASLTASLPAMPVYVMPTVTLMDSPSADAPRLLISGGLELSGSFASNPPADLAVTMFQVTYQASGSQLTVSPLPTQGFTADRCGPSLTHFRAVAFDAAILLPSGDRVLANGGTPRSGGGPKGCADCEEDDDLTCATQQSVIVSVPPPGAAGVISRGNGLQVPRFGHTLSLLPDGNVLVVGGLTRRQQRTYAVAQAEIFNPARLTPPTAASNGDADDPLHDELLAMGLSRAPGGLAVAAGAGGAPKVPCVQPKK